MFQAAIITASDKGSQGLREDVSGQVVREILEQNGYHVVQQIILPDDRQQLAAEMERICLTHEADLILTTGGTGFAPRDVTPEATIKVCEKLAPGIPEAMRAASMQITPKACLSRAAAGIRGTSLIINLPGSPKGACENLQAVLEPIEHGIYILQGGKE